MKMKGVACETLIWLSRSIYFSYLDLINITHHILAHTIAPSYQEYQRSSTVQEEGLTNDLHKQAHDKKHSRITKRVHKLGYRLTAGEVGVFSREIFTTCKNVPSAHSLRSHLNSLPM